MQVKYIRTSEMKIWNTLHQGKGGFVFENAGEYHLNAPGLVVENILLIGMLALFFFAAGLYLLSSASLLEKGQKFLRFSPLPLLQGLQL